MRRRGLGTGGGKDQLPGDPDSQRRALGGRACGSEDDVRVQRRLRRRFSGDLRSDPALEGSPQRARTQTAKTAGSRFAAERTWLVWATKSIVLPTVRLANGTMAGTSGVVVAAKGIDGAVRGLVRGGRRPNLVIGDDLETQESAYSKKQVDDRKRFLQRDVMGLSGPNNPMPVLVLGTIITSGCLMDQLTDRSICPEWGGVRLQRIVQYPARMDLWEKYFEQRKADQRAGDKSARTAHAFYLTNQIEMDEGAEVSTPYRVKSILLPDGTQLETSAIQSAMNDLCDMGKEGFDAEHQGQPHKDERQEGSPLDPVQVMRKVNGIPKGFVPPDTAAITIGIDIGARQLHWVAIAWKRGLIGDVFDYGFEPVHSPLTGNLKDDDLAKRVESAIFDALVDFREWETANGWQVHGSGGVRHADLINIDTGYKDLAVFDFLKSPKGNGCYAVAGYGSTTKRSYPKPIKDKARRIGRHWWASIKDGQRAWLHHVDSDHWKLHVQTGFMLKAGTDGSLSLFGDNPVIHSGFAKQICAERWMEEFVPGKGIRQYFSQEHRHNHYLDCMHYATVGAEMMGLGGPKPPPRQNRSLNLIIHWELHPSEPPIEIGENMNIETENRVFEQQKVFRQVKRNLKKMGVSDLVEPPPFPRTTLAGVVEDVFIVHEVQNYPIGPIEECSTECCFSKECCERSYSFGCIFGWSVWVPLPTHRRGVYSPGPKCPRNGKCKVLILKYE